jgi:hypothetical protein
MLMGGMNTPDIRGRLYTSGAYLTFGRPDLATSSESFGQLLRSLFFGRTEALHVGFDTFTLGWYVRTLLPAASHPFSTTDETDNAVVLVNAPHR